MTQAISCERTLSLPEYAGQTVGSVWPVSWPSKNADDDEIDFSLDVTGWLEEIQDTLSTVVAIWEPNSPADDFELTRVFALDGVITVIASGGTPWLTYVITIEATSAALGQKLSRSICLPVEALYTGRSDSSTSGQVSGVAL